MSNKWVLKTVVMMVTLAFIVAPLITSYAANSAAIAVPQERSITGTIIESPLMASYSASNAIIMEFEEQIQMIRNCYKRAYVEEKISERLYLTVEEFLNNEEEKFVNSVDSITLLGDLPENYKNLVFEYSDVCREDLAHIIMNKVESGSFNSCEKLKDAVNPYFEEYNMDMKFIQKELEIYGIKEYLIIRETEFPALNAKG